jgi:S-adenosylmethionine hydrolase
MSHKCITFLSDFGTGSLYPAQMKAVALGMTNAQMIDITHDIQPQNIRQGAFVLRSTAPLFPPGTVHVAVVDPGVGTTRRGLLITTRSQIFIGPNNGLLIPAAKAIGDMHVYELTNEKYMRNPRSKTFDGRDVFTPVAAHVINGVAFEEFGNPINDYIKLDFGELIRTDSAILGKVVYIDGFGNIITNIMAKDLMVQPQQNHRLHITIGKNKLDIPFTLSYGYVEPKQILATIGSSNYLEIAQNQGNAAQKLKISENMPVSVSFD